MCLNLLRSMMAPTLESDQREGGHGAGGLQRGPQEVVPQKREMAGLGRQ